MAPPPFRVLTLNTWVGDYRRGYCSRDAERLRWMESQVRGADADVLCLQEVLEADMQRWWEAQFPEYRFEMLHQSSSAVGRCVWLLVTLLPALLISLCLSTKGLGCERTKPPLSFFASDFWSFSDKNACASSHGLRAEPALRLRALE